MSAHSPALSTSQRLDSPADHGDAPGFPLFPLASVLLATLVLVTALAWSGTKRDRVTAQFVQEAVRITEIRGAILRLDEALTMSARMAVATGDMAWRERYDKFAPMLDKSIADALTQVTPEIERRSTRRREIPTRCCCGSRPRPSMRPSGTISPRPPVR